MISEKSAKQFCSEEISRIENYDRAIADTTQTWLCHHRNGVYMSVKELQKRGLYFHRPADELLFLTKAEHSSLHNKYRALNEDTCRKISESMKGKRLSAETRKKISESLARRRAAK